jgi:hypothetical protein
MAATLEINDLKDQVKGLQEFILSEHFLHSHFSPYGIDINVSFDLQHNELTA